jgi:hypothetical protein
MTALPVPQHPILGCVAEIEGALDAVADAQAIYLSTAEKGDALERLAAIEARVAALRLGVMAAAGDVAEATGARDVAAWCSHQTLTEPEVARADERLARSLGRDRLAVAAALAAGRCSVAQARVIVQVLDELPDRVGPDVIESAEVTLVGHAARFRPSQLRRLGRHILDVVAPEIAEAEEARRLTDEERHAREKTRLALRPLGDGTTRITVRLPDVAASRLRTYLEAFTSPRAAGPAGAEAQLPPVDRMPYPRRLGLALCSLLEHLDPAKLPHHGGDATTVMVTMTLDQLRTELATAGRRLELLLAGNPLVLFLAALQPVLEILAVDRQQPDDLILAGDGRRRGRSAPGLAGDLALVGPQVDPGRRAAAGVRDQWVVVAVATQPVQRRGALAGAGVDRRAAGRELEHACGGVHEPGRAGDGVRPVALARPRLGDQVVLHDRLAVQAVDRLEDVVAHDGAGMVAAERHRRLAAVPRVAHHAEVRHPEPALRLEARALRQRDHVVLDRHAVCALVREHQAELDVAQVVAADGEPLGAEDLDRIGVLAQP